MKQIIIGTITHQAYMAFIDIVPIKKMVLTSNQLGEHVIPLIEYLLFKAL